MTKYYIELSQISTTTYEVDAVDEDDALTQYEQGKATTIDNYDDETWNVWEAVD